MRSGSPCRRRPHDLLVHHRHQTIGRVIAGTDDLRLRHERVAHLDEQVARRHAGRRVPGRRGQDLGPEGVARDRLLVLERHGAVGLLEHLPAADGGRPAAERHVVIAHVREERDGRAVADRGLPLLVSILVELAGAPGPPRRGRSPRAAPCWGRGTAAAAAGGSRRPSAAARDPWLRRLARGPFRRGRRRDQRARQDRLR